MNEILDTNAAVRHLSPVRRLPCRQCLLRRRARLLVHLGLLGESGREPDLCVPQSSLERCYDNARLCRHPITRRM